MGLGFLTLEPRVEESRGGVPSSVSTCPCSRYTCPVFHSVRPRLGVKEEGRSLTWGASVNGVLETGEICMSDKARGAGKEHFSVR